MRNQKPPFEITNSILDKIARIAELVGRMDTALNSSSNLMLRRTNRIRTIYSSLAIEQNTLSLEQVTAVLNGKQVLAPIKDITEVKNAYEIYEKLECLNPYSVDDLLKAHLIMTRNLVEESGCFRSGNVGVVDNQGNVLHFGTLPDYVPGLTADLLEWTEKSDFHMLIKSCVFHYELELIHPFADGNGRIGRLWHTLLLSRWKPFFAWLPVESIIYSRQSEYYKAINQSNSEGESTAFIEFMLSAIEEALIESTQTVDNIPSDELRWFKIEQFLKKNKIITNADVRNILGVSSATASRIFIKLSNENKIKKIRMGKSWGYVLSE